MKIKLNPNYKEFRVGFMAFVYALVLLLVLASGMTGGYADPDANGWSFWYMFTNQSNILVCLWLICYGIGCFVDGRAKRIAENNTVIVAVTLYISITFFIVATVLEPFYSGHYDLLVSNTSFILHAASTLVMWVYFFMVRGKGGLKYKNALLCLIYPFLFVMVNLVVGYNVKWAVGEYAGQQAFAYNFINPNSYGGNILVFVIVIALLIGIFGSLGVLLIRFRKFLNKYYHLPKERDEQRAARTEGVDTRVDERQMTLEDVSNQK
ncbi:MAG: Pr6Pr family membrane protein [Firmicutes bacterium]|nr:Pr6Pr family membrane protein [Bacillota bacterium]